MDAFKEEYEKNIDRTPKLSLSTHFGNILMLISDEYFDGQLATLKDQNYLNFIVKSSRLLKEEEISVKVGIANKLQINMGTNYTARVDKKLKQLIIDMYYNGTLQTELTKIRIQIMALKTKKEYSLNSTLTDFQNNLYQLNTVFKRTVGGMLNVFDNPICKAENCIYSLNITQKDVEIMNIESYLISKIETLSIHHFDEYYNKSYIKNEISYFQLPYEKEMEGLDVTISLIPVSGSSGLFINAKTLPLNLEQFDWKEKGEFAKRITIKWKELEKIKAEKTFLFIAVGNSEPGEYLLKMDAHEEGFLGRLYPGVSESGFIQKNQYNNYMYIMQVFETQTVDLTIKLKTLSGEANLYLQQCEYTSFCEYTKNNKDDKNVFRKEDSIPIKEITKSFKCELEKGQKSSLCSFNISVFGKEIQGTHYQLTLEEGKMSRLLTPGNDAIVQLNKGQEQHYRFVYPYTTDSLQLYLEVNNLYGEFKVIISKHEEFPKEDKNNIVKYFSSKNIGINDVYQKILITSQQLNTDRLNGQIYVTIHAIETSELKLNFQYNSTEYPSMIFLSAGIQQQNEICGKFDVQYYHIKIGLNEGKTNKIIVNLTPLKGNYILFSGKNGELPSAESLISNNQNNYLELNYTEKEKEGDYMVGVKLADDIIEGTCYQYMIGYTFEDIPQILQPGVLTQYTIQDESKFLIEVKPIMERIIIMKSIYDGYTISLCAQFTNSKEKFINHKCDFTADNQNVGILIKKNEIEKQCQFSDSNQSCYLYLVVDGNSNQKYTLGFTYNDQPFMFVKNNVLIGPTPLNPEEKLYFIYQADANKPFSLYFNSKVLNLKLYTKVVQCFNKMNSSIYPNESNYDKDQTYINGFITYVQYDSLDEKQYGKDPCILMTIQNQSNTGKGFDTDRTFTLQTTMETNQIVRTQNMNFYVLQNQWNYFNIYNNGNSESFKVYVSSNFKTQIEVIISKDLQNRPPFTTKGIKSKTGISNVEIDVSLNDLKMNRFDQQTLQGNYIIAVKSNVTGNLSIFWNNKNDLNYLELTLNQPSTMAIEQNKSFYFGFFVSKNEENNTDPISFHFKSNKPLQLYMLSSKSGELEAPSQDYHFWENSLGTVGGVSLIKVDSNDKHYCQDCLYIGKLEGNEDAQISLLARQRNSTPVELIPGFTFPDNLNKNESVIFRVFNTDTNNLEVNIQMLNGKVNIYTSSDPKISNKNFVEQKTANHSMDIFTYFNIKPSKYKIKEPSNYYILLENTSNEKASFTISVDKTNVNTQIELGITKYIKMNPNESNNFIFQPDSQFEDYQIQVQVRQMKDVNQQEKLADILNNMLSMSVIDEKGNSYQINPKKQFQHKNKIKIFYKLSHKQNSVYEIKLFNKARTKLGITIDITNGQYQLANMTFLYQNSLKKNQNAIYEAIGDKKKYIFSEFVVCKGKGEIEYFTGGYESIKNNQPTQYKISNSNIGKLYYVKTENSRIFAKIKNTGDNKLIYSLNMYSEQGIYDSPYQGISPGKNGRTFYDPNSKTIQFYPLTITSQNTKDYYITVSYKLYITDNFDGMKYSKHCGIYLFDQAFDQQKIYTNSLQIDYSKQKQNRKLKIQIKDLENNHKYYGVLIGVVELYPLSGDYIQPIRKLKTYYDEFSFYTPMFQIHINLIISIFICLAVLLFIYCIIQQYLFGNLNKFTGNKKNDNLEKYSDNIFGPNVSEILEYNDETSQENIQEGQQQQQEVYEIQKQ